MVSRTLLVTLALLAACVSALAGCGITAPRGNEGFADLDSLGLRDTDRVMSLSIGPAVLGFAARHVEDDPETEALLRGLDGVRVRIYEIDGDPRRVAGRIDAMSRKLQADDWQPVAVVRDAQETVHVLMRMATDGRGGPRVAGLTVLVCEREEAVLVNVMGDLGPELFSDAMAALDLDVAPDIRLADVAEAPATGG